MNLLRTRFAVASFCVALTRHTVTRLSRSALGALFLALLPAGALHAADETITWGFGPTPTSVSISVGNSVTWDGDMNTHPLRITNAAFTADGLIVSSGGTSHVQVFTAPGTYYFKCVNHGSMRTTVTVTCPPPPVTFAVLDVDANGQVDATTDGLLTLRYMLGLRGTALTVGALGACATRDAAAINSYLSTRVVP